MTWLWIALGVFLVLMLIMALGTCRLATEADERMRQAFEIMMEGRSHNADGLSCREAGNADES